MIIKTNLSWNTLARYSAFMWNNGEDEYTADGGNWVEMIDNLEDGDTFTMDAESLKSNWEYLIWGHKQMLEDDYIGADHESYLEGYRDEKTVAGNKEYLKQRREIDAFRRDYEAWCKTIEETSEWEFDTDDVEFITFPRSARGNAVPILH